jgi:hypothetical protein
MGSLYERAKAAENEINYFGLPTVFIEKFVFDELCRLKVDDYNLNDLLSPRFIESILDRGAKIINSRRTGLQLYNLGPKGTELKSPSGDEYQELFEAWERAGWIETYEGEDNLLIAKMKR